jgi:hypothetical protein
VQYTNRQHNLPEIGQKIAYKANRDGVAERVADPAVPKTMEVDLALLTYADKRLQALELSLFTTAKHHDAPTLYRLQTVPGIGQILSLVRLYAMHDLDRFPTVQEFVSDGRLVTCAQESAGKRLGTSGKKIGNAHLTWAVSEAAALSPPHTPAGQQYLARLAKKHDTGKALTILVHKPARAVYDMLKRHTAVAMGTFLHGSGSRAGAPGTSRDTTGISLSRACTTSCCTASLTAKVRIGLLSQSPGCDWTPARAPEPAARVAQRYRVRPLSRA